MVTQRHYRLNALKIQNKKLVKLKPKLEILKHISKRNCALLPYLNDESLHTLGEFIFNVINQKVRLDEKEGKVGNIETYLQKKLCIATISQ